LDEDSVANNFANASKLDASEGTSKHNKLQHVVTHATLLLEVKSPFASPHVFQQNVEMLMNN